MLGKGNLKFRRLHFVKDLYQPKEFLNNFDMVEFQNSRAFSKAVREDFYTPRGEVHVHIHNTTEFEDMKKIILRSVLTKISKLHLILHDYEALQKFEGLEEKRFALIVGSNFEYESYRDKLQSWYQDSPIYFRFIITFQNIDTIIEDLIKMYSNGKARLFEVKINYLSFNQATFDDIHRILFRWSRLWSWIAGSKDMKENRQLELRNYGFSKPIFVDSDLNLYYTEGHHRDKLIPPLFQLRSDENGEDVPLRELNSIRQYLDITTKTMFPTVGPRARFIDFYQNVLIHRVPNEIPLIAQQIMRWSL